MRKYRQTELGHQASNDANIRYNTRNPEKHKRWQKIAYERRKARERLAWIEALGSNAERQKS